MNKDKVKVGMILERDFPPDDRPEKEALSLIAEGYEVHMLCFTWQDRPTKENYKGIKITRFPINRTLYKKLSPTYLAFPIYKYVWKQHIENFVKDNNLDIIHIHDLPMTDIVHQMALKYGCKVVCDQHEYWSDWIVKTAHYNSIPGKIIKALGNWKKYEKQNLKKADLVITVTDPLKENYITEVGIDPQKLITVPNTPTRTIFRKENVDPAIVEKYKNDFVIFYAGAMDILRGLDVVIDALSKLEKHIPNIKFLVAGRFSNRFNAIDIAKEKGVEHLLEYIGWLDVEQLPSYIAAAKVCVFTPHATRDEINKTIATKIYQYLAMHKPIITSQAKMMHDFVVDNQIGFAIDSEDKNAFADCLIGLAENYGQNSKSIEQKSKQLIETQNIFWDQTVKDMIEAYARLVAS
ncbi:MAG: glycosyltransferase [Calditrichaeota bacterium]|nr:MAG: glycosyltransferase [Calditrichota bacterium]MBL1205356.1 glycosyltransferase [Calditrichota bacterium]NOG45185.1 glycosyltransferase family 4 protein [Calditrichota bacterium]